MTSFIALVLLAATLRFEQATANASCGSHAACMSGQCGNHPADIVDGEKEETILLSHARLSRAKCGFKSDCPQNYNITDHEVVVQSGSDQGSQEQIHAKAKAACASPDSEILPHGGWCYREYRQTLVKQGDYVDQDYNLSSYHVEFDHGFATALANDVLKNAGSVTDLGAGVGQFGHAIKALLPEIQYKGYDGAGNVEEYTNNYVNFADLTAPLPMNRSEWVVSVEVGEHIPQKFESQVIANIHAANCQGVVLTWAVLRQYGHGHVNCHSNQYMINIFAQLGYKYDTEKSNTLRASANSSSWLHNSAMVFLRNSKPSGC